MNSKSISRKIFAKMMTTRTKKTKAKFTWSMSNRSSTKTRNTARNNPAVTLTHTSKKMMTNIKMEAMMRKGISQIKNNDPKTTTGYL